MSNVKYESHLSYGSQLLPFICRTDIVFDSVTSIKPHWHESIEILHCIDGEGIVIINGTPFEFKPNTTIVVNPNQIHIISSNTYIKYNCIIVFDSFYKENGIDTDKYIFNSVINSKDISQLHQTMYDDFHNSENVIKIRLDALNLLYHLQSKFTSQVANTRATSVVEIKAAIEYTNRNYQDNISLDEIAKISNLSKYYFSKKFKEITGKTYNQFLNSVRCRKAANLLKSGKSLNDVCFSTGFNDPAYFSRVFKKFMGYPPSKHSGRNE